ncbi:hypothetical protein, partial [Escherichia coli]|uniref:hypothetical protein n=1 Tax=Escherichia coli TaxID=562 RepID=UPI00321B2400
MVDWDSFGNPFKSLTFRIPMPLAKHSLMFLLVFIGIRTIYKFSGTLNVLVLNISCYEGRQYFVGPP